MNPSFPYEKAPPGSPDVYRLTAPVNVFWEDVPDRFHAAIFAPFELSSGSLLKLINVTGGADRVKLRLRINPPFYFSISVAPNDPRAEPAACLHDWLYAHAGELAAFYKVPVKQILTLADHWFLALLRHYAFPYSSLYFRGVSFFGYAFNRLRNFFSGILK